MAGPSGVCAWGEFVVDGVGFVDRGSSRVQEGWFAVLRESCLLGTQIYDIGHNWWTSICCAITPISNYTSIFKGLGQGYLNILISSRCYVEVLVNSVRRSLTREMRRSVLLYLAKYHYIGFLIGQFHSKRCGLAFL